MSIFVYALSLVAFAGAMLFTLCSNKNEPRDGNLFVVALIPGAVVVCISMLLVESGLSVFLVLGTLIAALGAMVVCVWRVNMSGTYESVWGVMFYTSVPVWIIGGSLTALIRLL